MASVQYKKLHLPQDVKRMLYHCDKETRLKTNHANIDIDKSTTHKNLQGNLDYATCCKRYDNRIAELDAMPGKVNRRKDRVTCFGLYIPTPKDLKPEDEEEFFREVLKIIATQYGGFVNVVQYFIHRDEKHRFLNSQTGKISVSRTHMHVYVIPVDRKGKLNGKWFSSKSNMVKLNNSIHGMTLEKFNGVLFMDGSKKKSRKTVEQLKNESVFLETQKELEAQKAGLDARQDAVCKQEAAIDIKAGELQEKEKMIFKTQITLNQKEADLKCREDDVKAQEDDSDVALQQAVELRDTALQVLQRLQEMEEEDRQLIEIGKRQLRRQRVSRLEDDAAVKAYYNLDNKINDLMLQK